MPSRPALLILGAGLAFLAALLTLLPARVLGYVLPETIVMQGLSGTVWKGRSEQMAVNGRPLGALQWALQPLALLRGRLALAAELTSPQGVVRGRFALGAGGQVHAREVELRWPLAALPLRAVPPGWNGEVHAALEWLEIDDGVALNARGTLEARALERAPPNAVAIGSYRLTFAEDAARNGTLIGTLADIEGPMRVAGTLTLTPARAFLIEGRVAPAPGAPEPILRTLRFLGAPDAQGRRPFSVSGTY